MVGLIRRLIFQLLCYLVSDTLDKDPAVFYEATDYDGNVDGNEAVVGQIIHSANIFLKKSFSFKYRVSQKNAGKIILN